MGTTCTAAFIIDVLERLQTDSTRYVTRSVANCLNDMAKSDADLVIAMLKRWHALVMQDIDEIDWMTQHALHTLTRQYHPQALALLGYNNQIHVYLVNVSHSETVALGGAFEWSGHLSSKEAEGLLVTLAIHFPKARGRFGVKVFALAKTNVEPGQTLALGQKSRRIRIHRLREPTPLASAVPVVNIRNILTSSQGASRHLVPDCPVSRSRIGFLQNGFER